MIRGITSMIYTRINFQLSIVVYLFAAFMAIKLGLYLNHED